MESALIDTKYDLELEKIKNKLRSLYRTVLTKAYKMSNPGASASDIANFLEKNDLEFKGDGFDEEAEDLESFLDWFSKEDDIDSVSEKEYSNPEVEKGKELKSKSNEKLTTPKTVSLKVPKEGLFTPNDKHSIPKTTSLKVPRGTIKRVIDDNPVVNLKEFKDIWDAERNKLLELVQSRNKEFGVIL
jgi:hypothetical protein